MPQPALGEEKGPAILIENVTKKYASLQALENVSLSIAKGEAIGILGPNGAGKTTLVSIISTLRNPTYGKVRIWGSDTSKEKNKIRRSIGMVFQGTSLDPKLTVMESLLLHASLFDMDENLVEKAVQETMIEFGLHKIHGHFIENLSGGQRQLVEIAKSMVHSPKIYIFDEPTVGLDPEVRKLIWEKIRKISENKENTVIITSHYLEEIEHLCERVVFLKKGRVLGIDSISNLKSAAGRRLVFSLGSAASKSTLEKILGFAVLESGGIYSANYSKEIQVSEIVKKLSAKGIEVKNIAIKEAGLEELYLKAMGESR